MKRTIIFWLIFVVLAVVIAVHGKSQQGRYGGKSSTTRIGKDTYLATKTVIKTISVDDDASTDDFQFDDDAADMNAQDVDLGAIVPAWAEILSAQVRCFFTATAGRNTVSITLGTTETGNELLAQAENFTVNVITATPAGDGPEATSTAAAKNVWIQADPSINWNALDAGRWAIEVTYIDYGAVYTADVP